MVVDCASQDQTWHGDEWLGDRRVTLQLAQNLGFTGGNNLAWRRLDPEEGNILFLNPDVVLPPGTIARLQKRLEADERLGAVGPRLLHYDFARQELTGRIDSSGIFQSPWGRWFDRQDGGAVRTEVEEVPALCGAALLARVAALRVCPPPVGAVFDARYFAYKEDIELALRLRSAGWKVAIDLEAQAWHGRGWQPDRKRMARRWRLLSARNEIRLHATYRWRHLPMSLLKWCAVACLDC